MVPDSGDIFAGDEGKRGIGPTGDRVLCIDNVPDGRIFENE